MGFPRDFFGKTQNWESATTPIHGSRKSHSNPNNPNFFSQFLSKNGFPLYLFFPSIGIEHSHSYPNNANFLSQFLSKKGFPLYQFFPSIGIEHSHSNPNNVIFLPQVLSKNGFLLYHFFHDIGILYSNSNPNINGIFCPKFHPIMCFLCQINSQNAFLL